MMVDNIDMNKDIDRLIDEIDESVEKQLEAEKKEPLYTTCVIVGAGDCESIYLNEDVLYIAADGGYIHCRENGIHPDLLVGDLDSIGDYEIDRERTQVYEVPAEKDETDLFLAIDIALDYGCKEFMIFGALGGKRISHTIGNIQLLSYIAKQGATGALCGENVNIITGTEGNVLRNLAHDRYVSIFSITPESKVNLEGFKYSGCYLLTNDFPLGISNEIAGDIAEIDILEGEILIVTERKS